MFPPFRSISLWIGDRLLKTSVVGGEQNLSPAKIGRGLLAGRQEYGCFTQKVGHSILETQSD